MRALKSCGILVLRDTPRRAFLLMKHPDRYDLPKGHIRAGETEHECAFRELEEETGLTRDDIELSPDFRFETRYKACYKRLGGEQVDKTLVVFLGRLLRERPLRLSEHQGYRWVDWAPPHHIQEQTIDPLLQQVERHLDRAGGPGPVTAAPLQPGDEFHVERTFTPAMVEAFAGVSADRAEHHTERDSQGRLLVHGLLLATLGTEVGGGLNYLARTMSFEFFRPVYTGDTVRCTVRVESVEEREGRTRVTFSLVYRNQEGTEVLRAGTRGVILRRPPGG